MKQLLTAIALLAFATTHAQTFQWNAKSPAPAAKEVVAPSGQLAAYDKAYNERQSGLAGIYNPSLDQTATAFGEVYKAGELTASHALLPLGTLVRVVNLDNGRNVTVRINDRGQECGDCLIALSQASADALSINYRGRVTVERVGFSNWNPNPRQANYQLAPAYAATPATYSGTPAAGGVVRPASVGGETTGWEARGGQPTAYGGSYGTNYGANGRVAPATQSANVPSREVAVLGAPSVLSREVDPATRANQPATYSRRPAVVTPPAPQTTYPAYRQPQVYQAPTTYQAPVQQAPAPSQVVPQAAPPQPTVTRYQQKGGTVVPESYGVPAAASAPSTYAAVPAVPTAAAANTTSGFVVQLGAYNNELYAQNRVNQLKAAGLANVFYLAARKADGQVINRVYAGTFASMAAAQAAANDIRNVHQIAGIVTKM